MKINYNKSGFFPLKYLDVPLHHKKLKREDIEHIVDKIMNMIPRWQGRLLSQAARLALLKACLASIPLYLMSAIKFPKWAIDAINSHMGNFLWDNQIDNRKYHLSNW
jgi:hypothetical protein